MGADLRNLFFCESCDGSLQQVTREIVRGLDLKIFSGYFRCCALRHDGCCLCDRQKLRTPMLGIYAQHHRQVLCRQGSGGDSGPVDKFPMERLGQDREDMFPRTSDFATDHSNITKSVQVRELFGALPDMLEERIRSSVARQISTSSLRERAGSRGAHQEPQATTQASGSARGLKALAEEEHMAQVHCEVVEGALKDVDSMSSEGEITDLDLLIAQDAEVVDLDAASTANEQGTVTDEPSNIHNRNNPTVGDKTVSLGDDGEAMDSVEFVQSDWI